MILRKYVASGLRHVLRESHFAPSAARIHVWIRRFFMTSIRDANRDRCSRNVLNNFSRKEHIVPS
jgi:hypothetical protein